MQCRDLLDALSDYVDGDLDESVCAGIEEHLKGCNPCRVEVDTVKRTVALFKDNLPYEIPLPVQDRLHRILRERWRKKMNCP
jgi:predicted anti-sigma-YlaC factor YlaD